jgi:hypothetical protein
LGVLLAEKKKQVVAEKAEAIRGRLICADKPILSIIAAHFRWHRAYNLTFKKVI